MATLDLPNSRIGTKVATAAKSEIIVRETGKFTLTNKGPFKCWVSDQKTVGDLNRDDAERVGEVPLDVGDSIPLPDGATVVEVQCLAAESAILWVLPLRS